MKKMMVVGAVTLGLAGCQTTGGGISVPSGAQSSVSLAVSYACPILAGFQVSSLKLTAAQRSILDTAVTDCTLYQANPAGATSPAAVAAVLVQAAVILQTAQAKP